MPRFADEGTREIADDETLPVTVLTRIRFWLERVLEVWVMFLISALTVIVVLAVIWRKAGASFVWYDEVGSIMLAWITYYGAALAALKRAHIGFDGILLAMPLPLAVSLPRRSARRRLRLLHPARLDRLAGAAGAAGHAPDQPARRARSSSPSRSSRSARCCSSSARR